MSTSEARGGWRWRTCAESWRTWGSAEVATLLQSGNAAFTAAADAEPAGIAAAIEGALVHRFGLSRRVLVRTPAEIAAAIAADPFLEAVDAPTTLHVAFVEADADPDGLAALPMERYQPDQIRSGDRVLYLHLPNGAGRSKLTIEFERRLGVVATARNWDTVNRLLALAEGRAPGL